MGVGLGLGVYCRHGCERARNLREDCDHVSRSLQFLIVLPHLDLVAIEDGFSLPQPRVPGIGDGHVIRADRAGERIRRNMRGCRSQG